MNLEIKFLRIKSFVRFIQILIYPGPDLILDSLISLLDLFLQASNVLLQVSDDTLEFGGFLLVVLDFTLVVFNLPLQTGEFLAHDASLPTQLLIGLFLISQLSLILVLDVQDLPVCILLDLTLCFLILAVLLAGLIMSLK